MGFDHAHNYDQFDRINKAIQANAGLFATPAERQQFFGALTEAYHSIDDAAKKTTFADTVLSVLSAGLQGGIKVALTTILASVGL